MKLRPLILILALVGALAFTAGRAFSDEDPDTGMKQPSPEEMSKAMEEWMKAMKPGPQHKMLAECAGDWDVVMKTWWGGPGSPAQESKGKSTIKTVLDGRYIHEEFKGNAMMPDPKNPMNMVPTPFEGMGMLGYDNVRKLFVGTWCDSLGTQILVWKGTMPPGSKTMTCYGEMDEPMMGMYGRMVKYETKFVSDDKRVFSMYDLAVSEDYKVMEITYTRAK